MAEGMEVSWQPKRAKDRKLPFQRKGKVVGFLGDKILVRYLVSAKLNTYKTIQIDRQQLDF